MLNKLTTKAAQGICVLPDWPTQPWYPRALQLLKTKPSVSQERLTSTVKQSQEKSSDLAQAEPPRMSLIREGLNKYSLSPAAKDVLMASWRRVPLSNTTHTLTNEISTVGTKTLMFFSLGNKWHWISHFSLQIRLRTQRYKHGAFCALFNTSMGDKSSWDSCLNRVLIATFYLFNLKFSLHWEPAPLPRFNVVQEKNKF